MDRLTNRKTDRFNGQTFSWIEWILNIQTVGQTNKQLARHMNRKGNGENDSETDEQIGKEMVSWIY